MRCVSLSSPLYLTCTYIQSRVRKISLQIFATDLSAQTHTHTLFSKQKMADIPASLQARPLLLLLVPINLCPG